MSCLVLAFAVLTAAAACEPPGDGGNSGANALAADSTYQAPPPPPAEETALEDPRVDPANTWLASCGRLLCSWKALQERTVVRSGPEGILYRLSLLPGVSSHPGGDYPDRAQDARIAWESAPQEVFVFCSRRLPAVIYRQEEFLAVDVLDFVEGPRRSDYASANHYSRICHGGADWSDSDFAERSGYRRRDLPPFIDLDRPEEIFENAREDPPEQGAAPQPSPDGW